MPNWKYHNDWAERFGIPRSLANWVNKREDFPKFDRCNDKSLEKQRQTFPNTQPSYEDMQNEGQQHLEAWLLHILIDELEDICDDLSDDISPLDKGKDLYKEAIELFIANPLLRAFPSKISSFVLDNITELLETLPLPHFQMIQNMIIKTR